MEPDAERTRKEGIESNGWYATREAVERANKESQNNLKHWITDRNRHVNDVFECN